MSDEMIDRLDAWGRAELAGERARAEDLPVARLTAAVTAARRARIAWRIGVALLAAAGVAWLAVVLASSGGPPASAPPAKPAPIEDRPLRAIDR